MVKKAKIINPNDYQEGDIIYMVELSGNLKKLSVINHKHNDLYCYDVTDSDEKILKNLTLVIYTLANLFPTLEEAEDFIDE